MIIEEFLHILSCPDDGYQLSIDNGFVRCKKCKRIFSILKGNVVELLPSRPYPSEQKANDYYLRLFGQRFEWNPLAKGWGDLSTARPGNRAYVYTHLKLIKEHLKESNGFLLDVSGGAGSYSLHFAKIAKLVVHNDLSVDSINHAYQQCTQQGLRNVLFARGDYYQMPFATNSFDSLICTGHTLTTGGVTRALGEMMRCLKPGGRFAIDFPNRARLLFRNKAKVGTTTSYGYNELPLPKSSTKIRVKCIGNVPVRFVPFTGAYMPLDRMFQILRVPPSTFVVLGEKE